MQISKQKTGGKMKEKFCFMLKTYEKDFSNALRLIKTFNCFNRDNVTIFVVLPSKSIDDFLLLIDDENNKNIVLIPEEQCPYLVNEDFSKYLTRGYINQEIVKLWFWELNKCDNYLCLDSDGMFIRDFYINDFMYSEDVPFTVATEDKEMAINDDYYHGFWKYRENDIDRIYSILNIEKKKTLSCHGFQIINSLVMEQFKNKVLEQKGMTYADILKISPIEFSWYTIFAQNLKDFSFHPCEPFFKCFHTTTFMCNEIKEGVKLDSIKRSYVGIVVQTNFKYKNLKQKLIINRWLRKELNGIQ